MRTHESGQGNIENITRGLEAFRHSGVWPVMAPVFVFLESFLFQKPSIATMHKRVE